MDMIRPDVGIVGIGTSLGRRESCRRTSRRANCGLTCRLVAEIARLRGERRPRCCRSRSRHLAETDPLTGLPNRRAWERSCASAGNDWPVSEPLGWPWSIWIRFKEVNTACGMAAGDEVLGRPAEAWPRQLRRDDLIVRLGGDEFGGPAGRHR